ncbi:hypothetical protein Tsubulata_025903 [Turnera subulata]|uniref:CASP-like protein n=1 Tax=Turnera subulata TaxID=218843 RepID=A0A9Q0GI55_9ROSI|nr:hypothetical protein Tsubulata_025903 [Turnera subulata]
MKELFGGPGKVSGLGLRVGQFVFAAASIGVMVSAHGFFNSTAFCSNMFPWKIHFLYDHIHLPLLWFFWSIVITICPLFLILVPLQFERVHIGFSYLIASMGLQVLWSFGLACLDLHALRSKRNLQNPVLVSLFVVGDWVTSILSLAASCASAGVAVLYARDLHLCKTPPYFPCNRFQISILLAFISWFFLAISSHVMFWLLAAV